MKLGKVTSSTAVQAGISDDGVGSAVSSLSSLSSSSPPESSSSSQSRSRCNRNKARVMNTRTDNAFMSGSILSSSSSFSSSSPRFLLLLLLLTSSIAAAAAAQRGVVRDDVPGGNNNDNIINTDNNRSNNNIIFNGRDLQENNNNDDDGGNSILNVLNGFLDRLDGDFDYMWTSSPDQWTNECWEVFAIFAATCLVMALFVCYVFCVVPCSDNGGVHNYDGSNTTTMMDGGPRTEMTKSEFDNHIRARRKRTRLLSKYRGSKGGGGEADGSDGFVLMTDTGPTTTTTTMQQQQQLEIMRSPTALARDDLLKDIESPIVSAVSSVSNNGSPTSATAAAAADAAALSASASGVDEAGAGASRISSSKRTGRDNNNNNNSNTRGGWANAGHLWSETVDVWSEFLGFNRGPKLTPALLGDDEDNGATDGILRRRSSTMTTATKRNRSSAARRKSASSSKRNKGRTSIDADDDPKVRGLEESTSNTGYDEKVGKSSSHLSAAEVV